MASMRPRHYCRGRATKAPDLFYLQDRFNEAAALLPRKGFGDDVTMADVALASMRPRHYCRGRGGDHAQDRVRDRASMRPRHYCRGREAELAKTHFAIPPASMRPRHYCRGRERGCPWSDIDTRSFNEAAALLPRKGARRLEVVQHDAHASMRPRHYCRGRGEVDEMARELRGRFNEAAALLPRKGASAGYFPRGALLLQ